MVVQRTPPPVRRSPRKEAAAASEASFTSFTSQSSQARKIGKLPSSTPSALSQPEPSTPLQVVPVNDFPSLDQMAAVSKEQRSVSRPNNRAAFAANFPATTNHVPSSLPRPTAQVHRIQLNDENDENQRPRAARSSLTNGAIQRVRQQAGDETPLGVSQAKAARQAAAAASSSKAHNSMLADDSGDSTAQLVPGRRDAILSTVDVENPQLPTLHQTRASPQPPAHDNADPLPTATNNPADSSTASQASIFGTGKRRNGQDQPIGGASAGTVYDFSKYLDGELDPFNRASRANPRRESRPLPVQQAHHDDEAETSGDTTARGDLAAAAASSGLAAPKTMPVESTPLITRVKAAAATTPRMSPHASPSISSRKLAHLSSLSNGNASTAATPSAAADASTASIASHHRFDPSARTDRIQNMELGELRKKYTSLVRELATANHALVSAKEESEGWASECTGLQEQLTSLKSSHEAALARDSRARAELQMRLSQYKIEADDRAWKLLSQRRQACMIEVALQHAKNEATYHEGRYHATESELEGEKDELRIRLMLERKRADLLAVHVKAAMKDCARFKKRLGAKSAALLDIQAENEKLAEQLEEARQSPRSTAGDGNAKELKKQLEEAQAEIDTLTERDAMMAETRKTWKAERKQLLAQIDELTATASKSKPAEPLRTSKLSKPSSTLSMPPPSSPVYAKKKDRQPMQGASELGPPSEDEPDRRPVPAARKLASPLVPFAQISSKAATAKKAAKPAKAASGSKLKSSSKNWRDEVAITDSSEDDSDDGRDRRRGGRRADSEDEQDSDNGRARSKTKKKPATSGSKAKTNGSSAGAKKTLSRKEKPAMPIEYDDQTADPSATPIIRTNKRHMAADADSDDDDGLAPADSSVLAAKFGRDRTNFTLAPSAKGAAKNGKVSSKVSTAAAAAAPVQKKKRKLLGGGGGLQWGGAGGDAGETAGLAPNFDIPLELSPIKGGGGAAAKGAAFLAGFGLPTRNPFA